MSKNKGDSKKLHEMNDAEFEAYLKKKKITGMAAFNASRTRRAVIKAMGIDPNKPQPISSSAPSKDDPVLGSAQKLSGEQGTETFRDPLSPGKAAADEAVLSSFRAQMDKPIKPGTLNVLASPPIDPDPLPEGYKFTDIIPPDRQGTGDGLGVDTVNTGSDMDRALAQASTAEPKEPPFMVNLTPTFSGVMGIYRAVILDATRKGREELMPEIQKMAALADLCNKANRVIADLLEKLEKDDPLVDDEIKAMRKHMKAVEQLKAKFP